MPITTLTTIAFVSAALTTALVAGLLYAYSCSVNPGLGRLPDGAYLAAMQSINRAILNPGFFISFMGTLVLLPLVTWLQYSQGTGARFWLLLGATLVYAIGVFGVTMLGNVPLNEMLDSIDLQSASPTEISQIRTRFEQPWNSLHTVRTGAAILAQVLVSVALLTQKSVD